MAKSHIGVIGLAVMGKNLALNMESKGYTVSVFNRSPERTKKLTEKHSDLNIVGTYTMEEFVQSLQKPRRIMLMVKAGQPTDDMIQQLKKYLEPGDIVIDGGNAFYEDTIRRSKELEASGIHYIGAGVSGGEEGALHGPAIMPGGSKEAYEQVKHILTDISAKVNGDPCCTYIGPDGAGHYVKMVHNGIEYGDMQLIAEAYDVMSRGLCMGAPEIGDVFAHWNEGPLSSFLIELTARVLEKKDVETGKPLVDVVLDKAGQKGTGRLTVQVALDLGVPVPTIAAAVAWPSHSCSSVTSTTVCPRRPRMSRLTRASPRTSATGPMRKTEAS